MSTPPQSNTLATVETEDALSVTERVSVLRDGLINNTGLVINGALAILLVPLMLKFLGAEVYGFWIAVLSLSAIVSAFDFGLSWGLTREVAAANLEQPEVSRFITGAFNIQIILSLTGGLLIGVLGPIVQTTMPLSATTQRIAPVVFALAGLLFFGDRLLVMLVGLLSGLRKFGTANLILIASSLMRAAGIIALLYSGAGLTALAIWQALLSLLIAAATIIIVKRLEPRFSLRVGALYWREVRAHIPFSLSSSLATFTSTLIWDAPRMLIGVIFGPASVVPYHIGQRLPLIATEISWRATMALFPAASKYERAQALGRTRAVLEVGTRWAIVLTLPCCLLLGILAPAILRVWVGEVRVETVLILRLTAAAVFIDATGMGAYQVLLGFGAARTILVVFATIALANLGLTALLLPSLGIAGAAYGLVLVFAFISLATLHLAARRCRTSAFQLMSRTFKRLWIPAVACAATAFMIVYVVPSTSLIQLICSATASLIVYLASLYFYGAREEERALAHEAAHVFVTLPRALRRRFFNSGPASEQP